MPSSSPGQRLREASPTQLLASLSQTSPPLRSGDVQKRLGAVQPRCSSGCAPAAPPPSARMHATGPTHARKLPMAFLRPSDARVLRVPSSARTRLSHEPVEVSKELHPKAGHRGESSGALPKQSTLAVSFCLGGRCCRSGPRPRQRGGSLIGSIRRQHKSVAHSPPPCRAHSNPVLPQS